MADKTITSLAKEIQTSVEHLVKKFSDAGIQKTKNDVVTQTEKETLLQYLNREDRSLDLDNQVEKLTLKRKTRSTLSIPIVGGKVKSVNIEVRKKCTYINDDVLKKLKIEEKENCKEEEKKLEHEEEEKEKVRESRNNQKKIRLNQDAFFCLRKQHREVEIEEIKRKVEEEMFRKVEDEAKRITEESWRMAEENRNHWRTSDLLEDNTNYHLLTSRYAREAEDENDIQEEGHRGRNRNGRIIRQKKNNKYFEQIDREEERVVGRSNKYKGKQKKSISLKQNFTKPILAINRDVVIGETVTVSELANKMAVKGSQVVKMMMKMGAMVTINQVLDQETAQIVAEEMGHKVILRRENELEEKILSDRDFGKEIAEVRAPVVTIMGHVDHGKTSLLDCIRSTKVASSEAGGITQHIGAYYIETNKGMITFLDTPGHAAFTSMRARGAKVTDIIVLVVAADDGVMPQTIEAIQHAKAANVPIIVAINKIDKCDSDLDRVKNELSQYGILPEEWGGDNQFINVSAKKAIGIDELLEAILLQAELLELKAVRTGMASGVVIESYLDKGRGSVATILVQEGTLNKGDIVLCGFEYGRIRAMRNELGKEIQSACPSVPVEILGLSNVPSVGDKVTVVRDEKKAREVALYRQGKFREVKLSCQKNLNMKNIFTDMHQDIRISELNILLKTDVQGSCEAIVDSLEKLSNSKVKIKIISSGVGAIKETDATLAIASNAMIIAFNVRSDAAARRIIESEKVDTRYYSIIYNLLDDVKQIMTSMSKPDYKKDIIGLAEVRNVFKSSKFGTIAGCMVIEGIIKRNNPVHILRNDLIIYEGELESLRRFKDDVSEVRNGIECGISVKNYNDIRVGDIIEIVEVIEVKHVIDN